MRRLFYRISNLRLTRENSGCRYEAWIVVNGLGSAARGRVDKPADLDAAVMADVRRIYLAVTGQPLPLPDGQMPLPD